MENLTAIFIGIMVLALAFLFVDVTGGKKLSQKSLKTYFIVISTFGVLALMTSIIN